MALQKGALARWEEHKQNIATRQRIKAAMDAATPRPYEVAVFNASTAIAVDRLNRLIPAKP